MSLVEDWQRYGFSQVIYRKRSRNREIVELVPHPAWEYFERGIPVAFFTQDDIEVIVAGSAP